MHLTHMRATKQKTGLHLIESRFEPVARRGIEPLLQYHILLIFN